MLNVDQTFVRSESRDDVLTAIDKALREEWPSTGSAEAPADVRYVDPDVKEDRYFYVSSPFGGWVCVLESAGGDERLARQLSRTLNTQTVFFVYTDVTEEISLSVFDSGRVVEEKTIEPPVVTKKRVLSFFGRRPPTAAERSLRQLADEIYQRFSLPWQFYDYSHIQQYPRAEREAHFVARSFSRGD